MLTSIARAAIKRLVTTATIAATSSRQVAISRLRVTTHGSLQPFNIARSSFNLTRGLATRVQTKKPATATKKKTVSKTATAAKKKPIKAKAKPKAKPKVKAKAKAKAKPKTKAAAKAATKPRLRRKPLSNEAAATLQKKELKKVALFKEPKTTAEAAWQVFVAEQRKGKTNPHDALKAVMQELSVVYKALSPAEHKRLEDIAQQNKATNAAAYKAWVNTFTPLQIAAANRARNLLKRKFDYPKGQNKTIVDARLPKRPLTAYSLFTRAQWASGGLSLPIREAAAGLGSQWKSLTEADKKPYLDLAKTDLERYEKEVKTVLGRDLAPARPSEATA